MKKDDVKIGGTYLAKVTNKVVPVRLDAENRHGGWDATNLITNKRIRVKSAQRLRGEAQHSKAFVDARMPAREEPAPESQYCSVCGTMSSHGVCDRCKPDPDRIPLTKLMAKPKPAKAKKAKPSPAPEPEPSAPVESPRVETHQAGKTSGLDAAYQVLRLAGQAMSVGDVVSKMLADGMWQTGGKTPAATIYSAIIREIKTKGSDSRFRKAARGQFEAITEPREIVPEFRPEDCGGAFDGNTVVSDADSGL